MIIGRKLKMITGAPEIIFALIFCFINIIKKRIVIITDNRHNDQQTIMFFGNSRR